MSVLPSLAVGSRPGGWPTPALSAASRTPIPTGSRRSGSCRRWRGTRSFLGPQPEAGLRAPALQAAPARSRAWCRRIRRSSGFWAQGRACGSFGTTAFFTSDVFHQPFRKFSVLTGCVRYWISGEVYGAGLSQHTWPGCPCKQREEGWALCDVVRGFSATHFAPTHGFCHWFSPPAP